MILATAAALATALTVGAAQAQPPTPRAPQTDQTVSAARGAKLTLIETWPAKSWFVRGTRMPCACRPGTRRGRRSTSARSPPGLPSPRSGSQGPPASVDYEINAPAWMPLKIEGTYNFITVEGSQAEVSAETVRGDIVIKGGSGSVTAQSIEGEVTVDGARGRINAELGQRRDQDHRRERRHRRRNHQRIDRAHSRSRRQRRDRHRSTAT